MTNFYELKSRCIYHVAREIARPRVRREGGWRAWPEEIEKAKDEAVEKIKNMNGLELLNLLSEVLGED